MSYNQYDNAPARSGRSPMFFIGMGCLALVVVGFIGCVGAGAFLFNNAKDAIKEAQAAAAKPYPEEQVKAKLKEVPKYPNAKYQDDQDTRMARATMRIMLEKMKVAQGVEFAQYAVADTPDKVLAWYDAKMKALGYDVSNSTSTKGKSTSAASRQYSHVYRKDKTVVQVTLTKADGVPGGILSIARFDGTMEGFNPDASGTGFEAGSEFGTEN